MPKIHYVAHDGTDRVVDVAEGETVMRGAILNSVPGIDADCGGECACATCHVYIDAAWKDKVGAPNEQETSMLSFVDSVQDTSRLSCQITVTGALDGLVVHLPESQH
ncbi:MAG: 2Fe-2S iron-sulfur cluster binding domain-containing protein [Rhodoblastus sp.]|nr:2Fe-2S iron-sulfur cluster binding domain-containing protein [Rhodoblastus sp.]